MRKGNSNVGIAFALIIFAGICWLLIRGCNWVATTTEDPNVPIARKGYDTALMDSSITTIEFNYDSEDELLTIVVEACPPLWFGENVGGDELQHDARNETKKQVDAFRVMHPELELQLVSQNSALATNMFRSAKESNRRTILTTLYSVRKRK